VITWNRSKKRDLTGEARQHRRPSSQWVQVDAPDLRIVSDELWEAAHRQLAAQRKRACGPTRYHGRKATYLLTGLLRCGVCGAGMEVRRQKHGKIRVNVLHCSTHHRKGASICGNARTMIMASAEAAILDTLKSALLNPAVLEAAIARAVERLTADDVPDSSDELRALDAELTRLTAAIASGGDVPSLVEAIRMREARRKALQDAQANRPRLNCTSDDELVADLRGRLDEWRALLEGSVAEARQMLRLLIQDRLTVRPVERGYEFSGVGTVEPILEGIVPSTFHLTWRPHRDSNPGFSLERAAMGVRQANVYRVERASDKGLPQ
jgi:site-specific DNA recombinase